MTGAPAALVLTRPPRAGAVKRELEPLLGPARCAALQALLIRRAVVWAAAAAPGAVFVAVEDGEPAEVAALVPAGTTAFAAEGGDAAARLAAAVGRVGRGPLLVAGTDAPRLSAAHAAAALGDLAAGCDAAFGPTLEFGWYLAALREPRPELLAVAPDAAGRPAGVGALLQRARELDAEVGLLRHERLLRTPADAAAFLADPLLAADVRAALATGG